MGIVELGDLSTDQLRLRYLLRNKPQAKALKKYLEKLGIPLVVVDKVYKSCRDGHMDVSAEYIQKRDYLVVCDLEPSPFTVGALNTLGGEESAEFFELFASVHNFNTFNKAKLIAHTFALTNESGSGRLSFDELSVLVHFVYGTHVAKAEAGLIVTTNKSDIDTAKSVMKSMDPGKLGFVTLQHFEHGIKRHANLLNPGYVRIDSISIFFKRRFPV